MSKTLNTIIVQIKKKKQQQNNVQLLIVVIPKTKKKRKHIFYIISNPSCSYFLNFNCHFSYSHTNAQTHTERQHTQTNTHIPTYANTYLTLLQSVFDCFIRCSICWPFTTLFMLLFRLQLVYL